MSKVNFTDGQTGPKRAVGIEAPNFQKTVKHQFWKNPKEKGVDARSIPPRIEGVVVPTFWRSDDQGVVVVSRTSRQIIALIQCVEVNAVGGLTIQDASFMHHRGFHLKPIPGRGGMCGCKWGQNTCQEEQTRNGQTDEGHGESFFKTLQQEHTTSEPNAKRPTRFVG